MTEFATIEQALRRGADTAPAIGAPEQQSLTFAALRELVAATVTRLNALGIGRNDRVAIVLPNGPDMATAFLAIASGATTAPLNPAYRADEFEFYLDRSQRQGADRRGRLDNRRRSRSRPSSAFRSSTWCRDPAPPAASSSSRAAR